MDPHIAGVTTVNMNTVPTCADVVDQAAHDKPGVLAVEVSPREGQYQVAYDPARVSAAQLRGLTGELTPAFEARFGSCALRLDPAGGRSCESCAQRLETGLAQVPGVRTAAVSYHGGVLSVSYDRTQTTPDSIRREVIRLGGRVQAPPTPAGAPPRWRVTADQVEAVFTGLTLVAMLAALAADAWWPVPGLSTALYAAAYVFGGAFGLKAGIESLRLRTIDIDLLMVLAAAGAWIVGSPFEGAMLLFLFSLSNVLQAFAMDRTRNAIRALMKLRPTQALVRRGSATVLLPIETVAVDDVVVVRPGERIPLDGLVIAGESAVDQSSITGESMPVAKQPGMPALAGTINGTGGLEVRVTRLAADSTLAKMIKLVEEAHGQKAKAQRWIDRFEQSYAVGVIVFTALVFLVPYLFLGEAFAPALYRAMTVMVAASPCALVISTPASILSAIGAAARRGVLFKGGIHVEQAARIKVLAFDKTGTLTRGKPVVTDVVEGGRRTEDGASTGALPTVLSLAAAVEAKSEHPLAQAIVSAAVARGIAYGDAEDLQAMTGRGVRASVAGRSITVGNRRYLDSLGISGGLDWAQVEVDRLQREGKTTVFVADADAGQVLGVIAVADVLRLEAAAIVAQLRAAGLRTVMLTGDHAQVAEAIARQAGVDEVQADLMPEDKLRIVRELSARYGPVAMVGDGVNDAPALAAADLGIAMGAAGTDVALETADVVLMADELAKIPYLIALSKATRRTLITNLGFALLAIAMMLAAIFWVELPLPLAVIGHEGGTVLVSLNGLRLLAFRQGHNA
jgi:Cd2+/Zn2+-exporting ATPase